MLKLQGKYSKAMVFTNNVDNETISQIIELCNQDFTKDSKIRIMSDCHKGAGCVIGFTANLGDKIIPNLIGVDISCGMCIIELRKRKNINLEKLDNYIRQCVPSGYDVHDSRLVKFNNLQNLYCYRNLKDTKRIERSIGTLGGGNHFIEINTDKNNNLYLVIHSGSRNFGKQVAEFYQNLAIDLCSGKSDYFEKRDQLIKDYKEQGKKHLIQSALKELEQKYKNLHPSYPKDLCFLSGEWKNQYLHDMKICQEYASLNRRMMANIIITFLGGNDVSEFNHFETIHNYINFKDNIIRKGAISAYQGEKVLIPMNMRDGSLLCIGKGNSEWNNSAPHGAGRIMSRSQAKENVSLEEFEESMKGIYTTSVGLSTLDESPMSYKPMEEIINNIGDTVDILEIIKPIYNFKAGG